MPYTHSLASAVATGGAVAALGAWTGRARAGAAMGAVVASHWALDWLVHTPDLHLGFGAEPRLGLGLWRWPIGSLALELALLLGAAALLGWRGRGIRRRALWRLIGALCVAQLLFAVSPAPPAPLALLLLAALSSVAFIGAAALVEAAEGST
jgi:hypothetical protein